MSSSSSFSSYPLPVHIFFPFLFLLPIFFLLLDRLVLVLTLTALVVLFFVFFVRSIVIMSLLHVDVQTAVEEILLMPKRSSAVHTSQRHTIIVNIVCGTLHHPWHPPIKSRSNSWTSPLNIIILVDTTR